MSIVMCFQGDVISTPAIKGTILPGITRKSIIDVARSQGFQVLLFDDWDNVCVVWVVCVSYLFILLSF